MTVHTLPVVLQSGRGLIPVRVGSGTADDLANHSPPGQGAPASGAGFRKRSLWPRTAFAASGSRSSIWCTPGICAATGNSPRAVLRIHALPAALWPRSPRRCLGRAALHRSRQWPVRRRKKPGQETPSRFSLAPVRRGHTPSRVDSCISRPVRRLPVSRPKRAAAGGGKSSPRRRRAHGPADTHGNRSGRCERPGAEMRPPQTWSAPFFVPLSRGGCAAAAHKRRDPVVQPLRGPRAGAPETGTQRLAARPGARFRRPGIHAVHTSGDQIGRHSTGLVKRPAPQKPLRGRSSSKTAG